MLTEERNESVSLALLPELELDDLVNQLPDTTPTKAETKKKVREAVAAAREKKAVFPNVRELSAMGLDRKKAKEIVMKESERLREMYRKREEDKKAREDGDDLDVDDILRGRHTSK